MAPRASWPPAARQAHSGTQQTAQQTSTGPLPERPSSARAAAPPDRPGSARATPQQGRLLASYFEPMQSQNINSVLGIIRHLDMQICQIDDVFKDDGMQIFAVRYSMSDLQCVMLMSVPSMSSCDLAQHMHSYSAGHPCDWASACEQCS